MMRRSTISTLLAGAVLAAAPAAAAAQSTPAPAAAKLSITTEQVTVAGGRASALVGRQWRVRVVLRPLGAGQTAGVRFYRDGRKVAAAQLPLAPSPTGQSAFATFNFTSAKAGHIIVKATHFATPQLGTLRAKAGGGSGGSPSARPGARGPVVRLLQAQLARLGYVVGQPGLYDARTARAVLAFRTGPGRRRPALPSSDVFRKLAHGQGAFHMHFPSHGKHVEADLSLQV